MRGAYCPLIVPFPDGFAVEPFLQEVFLRHFCVP
jgi:hypothetical protein